MIPCSPRGSQGTGRGGPLGGQAGRGRSKQAGRGRIHKQAKQSEQRPTQWFLFLPLPWLREELLAESFGSSNKTVYLYTAVDAVVWKRCAGRGREQVVGGGVVKHRKHSINSSFPPITHGKHSDLSS